MYTEQNVMSLILVMFPEFHPTWNEYVAYYAPDVLPYGIHVSRFSSFLRDKLSEKDSNNEDLLQKAFNLIEDFLVNGNEDVQYHAQLNLIENITNLVPTKYSEEKVRKYMGPESNKIYTELNTFWEKVFEDKQKQEAEKYAQLEREYEERTGKKYPFPVYDPNMIE